jgi:muramoyltetrapeptide carboxypeptidase
MVPKTSFWPLKAGTVVDVIAPGSSRSKDSLPGVLKLLREWDLVPSLPFDLFGEDLLYAHNNQRRFEIVRDAFYNPQSRVVWALSGGYGSTRLIPGLASLEVPTTPKTLIGFSDLTALQIFVSERWGWTALHGPVLAQIADRTVDQESIDHIKSIVFGEKQSISYESLQPLNDPAKMHPSLEATVTGGNISMIQSGIGTLWQIKTGGKIIFFEDVDERAYRTAERLEHLRQAGLFDQPCAVIFSNFSWNRQVEEDPLLTHKILERFASEVNFPVFRNQGLGHGLRNLTIPVNAPGKIERLGGSSTLSVSL